MSESMTDGELNELLKEKLLNSADADKLMDMQAEVVFAGKAAVTPPLLKEKELLSKLGAKAASKFSTGWIFTSLSAAAAIIITSVAFVMNSGAEENKKPISMQRLVKPTLENVEIIAEPAATTTASAQEHEKKSKSVTNPINNTLASTESSVSTRTTEVKCRASASSSSTVTPIALLLSTPVSETQTATPSVNPIKTENGDKPEDVAPIAPAKSPSAAKVKVSSCRIWDAADLCSTPDSLKFPYGIECDGCEYSMGCKEINGKKLTPVILRIYKKTGFKLENGFHNISLTTAKGVRLEPFAISIDRYMLNVKKLGVKFKNVVDMILLFPQASPGDKVTIDGVVEVVIEK